MKTLITILLTIAAITLQAQCTTFTVQHTPEQGAPYNVEITYKVARLAPYNLCWIAQNLGASKQANSISDANPDAAGWYYQFGKSDALTDIGTGWIVDDSDWLPENDPCQQLGEGWRLPTVNEWANTDAYNRWANGRIAYRSKLKLHNAGMVYPGFVTPTTIGMIGMYWTANQFSPEYGYSYMTMTGTATDYRIPKAYGATVRCVKQQ